MERNGDEPAERTTVHPRAFTAEQLGERLQALEIVVGRHVDILEGTAERNGLTKICEEARGAAIRAHVMTAQCYEVTSVFAAEYRADKRTRHWTLLAFTSLSLVLSMWALARTLS